MSVDVTADVMIARPIDEVAAYVMDPRNEPEWMPAIIETQPLGEGPLSAGTKVRRTAKFLGRPILLHAGSDHLRTARPPRDAR